MGKHEKPVLVPQVLPPGIFLKEIMEDRNLSQYQIMDKLNISNDEFNLLIIGDLPITAKIAGVLASLTNTTPQFWLNKDAAFRKKT